MAYSDTWKASSFSGIDSTYVFESITATTKNAIYWMSEGLEEAGSKFFVPPNDPRGWFASPAGPHPERKWQVQDNRIIIDFPGSGLDLHYDNSDPRDEYSITEAIYGGPGIFGQMPIRAFPWGTVGGNGIGSPFDIVWTEFNPSAGGSVDNQMLRRKAIYPRSSTPHGLDFNEAGYIPLVRYNRGPMVFDNGSHKLYEFTGTVYQPKSVGTIYIYDGATGYTPTHTISNVNLSDLTPGKTFTAGGKTYTLGNARYHYELNEVGDSKVLNSNNTYASGWWGNFVTQPILLAGYEIKVSGSSPGPSPGPSPGSSTLSCGDGSPIPPDGQLGNNGVDGWTKTPGEFNNGTIRVQAIHCTGAPGDSINIGMFSVVLTEYWFDFVGNGTTGDINFYGYYIPKLHEVVDNGWIADKTWTWVWTGNAAPTEGRSTGDTQILLHMSEIDNRWVQVYIDKAQNIFKVCGAVLSSGETLGTGTNSALGFHHVTLSPMTPPGPSPGSPSPGSPSPGSPSPGSPSPGSPSPGSPSPGSPSPGSPSPGSPSPGGPPSVSQPPMGTPSPSGSTQGPGNAGPPAPPVPANNPGNAGNGTGSTPLGSGIYQEFFTYTSSATEPAKVFRDITETQCISIDLKNREALASNNDAPSGDQPDDRPNGSDYYLYARWRDRSANISDLIKTSFKIDNCDPYIIRHLNAAGYDQYACDWVYLNEEVTDDTSGVVYYTVSVNGNKRKEVVDKNYVNPDTYHINETITIPSTPGTHNIEVRAYDQAENYVSNSFAVKRSAQTIVWNLLQAQRLPASPWMIEIRFKATISSNGPHLLEGYHSSMDHHWVVTPSAYWNGNQGQRLELADTYIIIEPDLTKNLGVAFVRTHDPADYWYSAKEFDVDTSQNPITDPSQITNIDDPVISINDPTGRTFTNSLTNEWAIRAEAGNIHVNGGRDFLTGYLLTEDPSFTPSKAPEWDGQLQQFVDTAGDGWEAMVSFGTFGISRDDTFSFTGTFGTKTVYLWVSTHGHSGAVPGFPKKFFRAEYTIEYINDFVGPWCRNIDVEELDTGILDTTTKVYSDYADPNYNPIETYQRDSEVTTDNIRITGEVYDNESWVHRYVLGSYGVPPPYSQVDPGVWTVLNPPVTATNFSGTFQLAFPNSMKTHYLWAVDVCGNYSRTMISTELKNPNYIIPTQGGTVGAPYKFEGKADEHKLRESIVSMFGDGVFHTGMISNQTPKVRTNRVHKLSEYRGLRVANTQNIPASNEFLPFPTDPANPQQKGGEPLKFSDFLFKVPRIDDLFVNAYIPPDTPTNTTEPAFVGDVRNIALTMDIDSGNQPQEWKSINDNVIDDSATWTASFIPKGSGGSQNINVGTVVQGVIQGYRFDNPGVYIFIGTSSFGKTASRTYIIYEAGTPVPPTQGPPVKVGPIDLTTDPFGQTDIEIDYFVDQVSLAVDVVMCIDRSGSYVDGFSNSLYDACFPNPSKKVRLLCATYPGYYGVFAITNNLTSVDSEIKEAFVNLKYLLKDRGPVGGGDLVSSLSSITSPSGNLASDWPILPGLLTANGEKIYKLHETATKDELVTTVMESAGLQAKEYADGRRDSHNSNSSSNRFNAYWFTDENFAEKTLVTAISQFARNSRTNFSDARFCIVWYWDPGSGMTVTTGNTAFGDSWTKFIEKPHDTSILPNANHKSLQEGIKKYKDDADGGNEPKVEAVARSATGEFPGAWRETAAKLVILFADECDGAPTNKSGGSSASTYTDSASPNYYRKLLIKNEVGFIYFDADKSYSNIPTKDQDGMLSATNATRKWGGLLDFLTLSSSPSDIANKMDDAFDLYQAGVTFDLISAINPPVILIPSSIQAKTGAGAHAPGTVAPIPYSRLVVWPGGGYDYRKKAVFKAKLDNAAVGSLGTDYIITYISIKNSSGIEIARKEIQIQVKR